MKFGGKVMPLEVTTMPHFYPDLQW